MCEICLTKLSCAAQQVGIVHFYAVTEIKGLSCLLWWMREWRNLLTSTHVGYRSVIWAVASGASLKFGVQGASATNWFSRVNGTRDNGIWLYNLVRHPVGKNKTLIFEQYHTDILFFSTLHFKLPVQSQCLESPGHQQAWYWLCTTQNMYMYCCFNSELISSTWVKPKPNYIQNVNIACIIFKTIQHVKIHSAGQWLSCVSWLNCIVIFLHLYCTWCNKVFIFLHLLVSLIFSQAAEVWPHLSWSVWGILGCCGHSLKIE